MVDLVRDIRIVPWTVYLLEVLEEVAHRIFNLRVLCLSESQECLCMGGTN
jgi:hypothetical protein